ncbi:zinc finger, CCHC-type containing protein [Tanacetum coccineum]
MHFLLSSMSVVYVLTTTIPEDGDDATVYQLRKRAKWDNDDYVCRDSLEAKYMAEDTSSKKFLVSNFTNYKMTYSRPVLEQYNELLGILGRFTQHKMNMDESIQDAYSASQKGNNVVGLQFYNLEEHKQLTPDTFDKKGKRATIHVCKDRCWFKTYESLNDGSILHMGNESTTLVHGRGCVDLRLGHVHFKIVQDMSKDGLIPTFDMDTGKWNKKYFVTFIDDASRLCYVYLLHSKDEALDKFKSVGIIHKTTAPYTPQQNGISERKNRVIKEMVNSMLSYLGLSQELWGEAMLTAYYLLKRVPNKRNKITPYELWTKRKPNLNYLRVWGCRAVVRLPDSKLKTLGERGIECIFVGYVKHSKAFRLYVIEPNDSVSINSIIESRDVIFDENRFSSVPRPSLRIPNGTEDISGSVVPEKVTEEVVQQPEPELRKTKRNRTPKDFGPEFQLYLIKGTRDEVSDQHSYCFIVEDHPRTFDEAIKSQDVAF